MEINVKRLYDPFAENEGYRILVDRLWPRGVSKEEFKDKMKVDLWFKDIAPSSELRQWFGHDPAKWDEFRRRYEDELKKNPQAVEKFRENLKGHEKVVFVYATQNREYNHARVLKEYLQKKTAS